MNSKERAPSYYAVIPYPILSSDLLKPNSKILYGIISSLATQKGYCYASNSYLSDLISVSNAAISRYVKELIDNGFLSAEYIKQGKETKERRLYILGITERDKGSTIRKGGSTEQSIGVLPCAQRDSKSSYNENDNKIQIPFSEILEAYKQILPELPQPLKLNHDRKKKISARWNQNPEMQNIDAWADFFNYIRQSDFLMGRIPNKTTPADIDWILSDTYFTRIYEGKYHR